MQTKIENIRILSESLIDRTKRLYRQRLFALYNAVLRRTPDGVLTQFLQKHIWDLNRTYKPASDIQVAGSQELEALLSRIASGGDVSQDELLPYLCLERKADRAVVNALLADAFFQRQDQQSLQRAGHFIQRAWLLSEFAPELIELYVKILSKLGNVDGIREAYKRLGIDAGQRGDVANALQYFDRWAWAHHSIANLDTYSYDFDILHCVDTLAARYRQPTSRPVQISGDEKIRVAHVLRGLLDPNSNLIYISQQFARYHDRSRFDVTFFAPESEHKIQGSPNGKQFLKEFEDLGYSVVTAPQLNDPVDSLLALNGKIREANPHIFMSCAALSDFSQYFLTALRPAPIMMGLVQGPPPQFAPPWLDWCISWTKHPLMDCPVNCSWVEIKLDYPVDTLEDPCSRKSLDLPDNACVLMSVGRPPKFQSVEFWRTIAELLVEHPESYYVAVGVSDDQVSFLDSLLSPSIRNRVKCLGWRSDVLRVLPTADVVIDTYPNGGGQTIVQAMALGIPLVAYSNDYMKLFDQNEWSPVEDFIRDPEIVIPRGDFIRFKEVVSRLIRDESYRRQVGANCKEEYVRSADPSRAIKGCEDVYVRVLESFAARSADSQSPD